MTDFVISNDLIVLGMSTFSGGQTFDGQMIVDLDNTEALLVRKDGDGGDVFIVDTSNSLVQLPGSVALEIGATPAAAGSIRLDNGSSITMRNAADNGDLNIWSSPQSNEIDFGDAANPVINVLGTLMDTNRIRILVTQAQAFIVANASNASMLTVDTSGNIMTVARGVQTAPTSSVDRLILDAVDLASNSTVGFSHSLLIVGKSETAGGVDHDSNWRMFVSPLTTTAFDGQSLFRITAAIDGAAGTEIVRMSDEGRFAISQPEQVSIGSPTFIDNVQVNITGSFIDDYGGGPTETHKVKIGGGQTGDTGRTNRQTVLDISNAFITTQNLSQTIAEVGGMSVISPSITPGTDTITVAYNLKVNNYPTVGTENYGLLVDGSAATANLTALVRIGKSGLQTGIKLLVGGSVGFDNLDANTQMRLTGIYTSDGTVNSASLLHVHTTLLPEDGTTDHITGAFFQGTLRTQVAADENVANISQVRIDEPNIQDNLTGTGEITNAQSLLITGAPTEGESNYAQRILGGDLQIANASAFLFRNGSDSADLTALSMGASNFLEIGGAGSAEFEQVSIYSLGGIVLFPTDDARVQTDGDPAFRVRTAGSVTLFQVGQSQTTVSGNLAVSGAGPHAIAGTPSGIIGLIISETFTSDGSGTLAAGVFITQTLVGASGDTTSLTGTTFISAITTQTETESITNISQVEINEPFITDNLTGSITNAQSLLITGAPTEGGSNWALRIISGDVEIGGDLIAFGAGGGGSRITFRGCSTFYLGNLDTPDEMFFGSGTTPTVASAVASFEGNVFKFRNSAANEQFMRVRQASALVATPSGSSATAAGLVPSGSFLVGVTTRVVTTVTGPAGYDVGDGADVDRWGNSIPVASGNTSDLSDATADAHGSFAGGSDVVITSDGVDFTGGSIRITVHYMNLQAPSS